MKLKLKDSSAALEADLQVAARRGFLRQGLVASTLGAVGVALTGCGGSEAATVDELPKVRFKTSQDPTKIWLRSALPVELLDTPEIRAEVERARALAGDDDYLLNLQRLQCNDFDDTYTIVKTPGGNVVPFDRQSSGRYEQPAIPTRVFDNVYYIGGMEVGGWLIDTGDGYIMLDSSYDYGLETILLPNMAKLGLDPSKVKYVLVTHGNGTVTADHTGGVKYFNEKYRAKVVLSSPEWAASPKTGWVNPDDVIITVDGKTLTLGNTTITMVNTPRNVGGGGSSYFIPVKVNGQDHLWGTYGNTGITGTIQDKLLYQATIANFITNYVDKLQPDIAMSSHPFVDASLNRMEMIRKGPPTMTNPFVIGKQAAKRYFQIMAQAATVQIMRQSAGLNGSGTARL